MRETVGISDLIMQALASSNRPHAKRQEPWNHAPHPTMLKHALMIPHVLIRHLRRSLIQGPDMGPKGPEWGTSLDVWWAHEGSWGHDYCKHGRMMCMIRWFWRSACGRLLDANACMMRSEIPTVSRIRSWSPDMGPKGPEWGTSLDVWWAHEGSWGHAWAW